MTVAVLAMMLCVAAAVVVLAAVAVPRVRDGDRVLTQDGETAVRDAQRRARALGAEARSRAEEARSRLPGTPAVADEPGPAPADTAPPAVTAAAGPPRPKDRPAIVAAADQRTARARERLARRLEWGEPEPGPRHRR